MRSGGHIGQVTELLRLGSILRRFIGVVVLHATWDSMATDNGYFVVAGSSFILLMVVTWYLHRHEVAQSPAAPVRAAGRRWAPVPGTDLAG